MPIDREPPSIKIDALFSTTTPRNPEQIRSTLDLVTRSARDYNLKLSGMPRIRFNPPLQPPESI